MRHSPEGQFLDELLAADEGVCFVFRASVMCEQPLIRGEQFRGHQPAEKAADSVVFALRYHRWSARCGAWYLLRQDRDADFRRVNGRPPLPVRAVGGPASLLLRRGPLRGGTADEPTEPRQPDVGNSRPEAPTNDDRFASRTSRWGRARPYSKLGRSVCPRAARGTAAVGYFASQTAKTHIFPNGCASGPRPTAADGSVGHFAWGLGRGDESVGSAAS